MSQYNDAGVRSFEADAACPRFVRVKLESDGKVVPAGATDNHIGTASREAFQAGDKIAVCLVNKSVKMVAGEAVAAGEAVYGLANGKIGSESAGAFLAGIALEAASADGDVIEVMLMHSLVAGS